MDKFLVFLFSVINRNPRNSVVSEIQTPMYMVHSSLGLSRGDWKLNYWKLR